MLTIRIYIMKSIYFLVLILCILHISYSQDTLKQKFGIYGGYNVNSHTADFNKLSGIPNCCPKFKDGSGNGIDAGIIYEYRIAGPLLIGTRLGLLTLDGTLLNEEATTIHTVNGPTAGAFEHRMDGKFMNIGLEPSLIFNPLGGLLLNAGLRLGMNISKQYDQVETLTKPEGVGTFLDSLGNDTGLRTRNKFSGDIPNANAFQIFLTGGLSYEIPLNGSNSLRAAPEVQYYFPITELVQNTNWKVNSLRMGLALKYVPIPPPPKQKLFERKYEIDTIQIPTELFAEVTYRKGIETTRSDRYEDKEKIIDYEIITRRDTIYTPITYKLTGKITAFGVDGNGIERPSPIFKVEEFVSNRLDPLLNYVFFEENSSTLPTRYKRLTSKETRDFELVNLFRDSTIQIYHNILNIIGKRMIENPSAKLTLIGCNSDQGTEKGNIELSRRRAEEVKSYLTSVWNISENRIMVQSRNLPQKASTPINEPDKIAENRRVEIVSDNEKITEPIFIEKIDRTANPPIARFKLEAEAEAGLKKWKVLAYQNSDKENRFEYNKEGAIIPQIDWILEQNQRITPKTNEPIIGELHLEDRKGNKHTSKTQTEPIEVISIQQKRINRNGDYEVEKFSLILFDFDKAIIEGGNKRIVDFIIGRIKQESEISITGYTDRTGDDKYNQQLSERRANSTKQALKRNDAQAIGVGEQKLLYDNDLPEGRFYCRTVEIEVKTKVK